MCIFHSHQCLLSPFTVSLRCLFEYANFPLQNWSKANEKDFGHSYAPRSFVVIFVSVFLASLASNVPIHYLTAQRRYRSLVGSWHNFIVRLVSPKTLMELICFFVRAQIFAYKHRSFAIHKVLLT